MYSLGMTTLKFTKSIIMSTQNVYAVFDATEMKLYQFAAPETVLSKDAVNAFIAELAVTLFGSAYAEEDSKNLMTAISKTNSIEELTEVLLQNDLHFNLIQVS